MPLFLIALHVDSNIGNVAITGRRRRDAGNFVLVDRFFVQLIYIFQVRFRVGIEDDFAVFVAEYYVSNRRGVTAFGKDVVAKTIKIARVCQGFGAAPGKRMGQGQTELFYRIVDHVLGSRDPDPGSEGNQGGNTSEAEEDELLLD